MKSRQPAFILLCLICLLATFHVGCALLTTTKCPNCKDPVSVGDAHYTLCSEGHGLYSCDHAAVNAHQH